MILFFRVTMMYKLKDNALERLSDQNVIYDFKYGKVIYRFNKPFIREQSIRNNIIAIIDEFINNEHSVGNPYKEIDNYKAKRIFIKDCYFLGLT